MAESKLNTIADLIAKAMRDKGITDEEFALILSELNKYDQLKLDIRNASKGSYSAVRIDEQAKNELIQRGREQERTAIRERLDGH